MKKPSYKIKSLKSAPKQPAIQPTQRITNDTVSMHRDEILSKGRKFKYPFQRSKHRIAIISVGLVALALLVLGSFTGLKLYVWQSTSDFTYRITQILPFPVAKIKNDYTAYENYLFELRSSVHWQEKYGTTDLKSPDGKRQIDFLKRSALEKTLTNSVAHSLAKKNRITVSNQEVDSVVGRIKTSGGNLEQILGESFNFTEKELRRYIKDNILRRKVAKQLDTEAPKRAEQLQKSLLAGKSFAEVAKESSDDLETKQLGGELGLVERDHANLPKEVEEKVFQLTPGQVSEVIPTASDYFIVRLNEKVDEKRAKVSIIRIKVKDMSEYLKDYRKQGQVSEYIKLPQIKVQESGG